MLNANHWIVGLSMKYFYIRHQHYSENTSVYGYGDFPEQIPYLAAIVEADTLRKAQNKVKKLFPRVIFNSNSPVISNYLLAENDRFVDYFVKLPLNHDHRLSPANQELHNSCVRMLEEVTI